MAVRANKGEWTELYVLLKLIAEGKLVQSDMDLNPDNTNIYQVMKSYKSEQGYRLEFEREELGEEVKIHIFKVDNTQEELLNSYTYQELTKVIENALSGIKDGKDRSFPISKLDPFLQSNQIKTAKANSGTKSDIRLKIYDHRLAKDTDLGFSIKSLLGENATLLNTGAGNNFIYKITNLPKSFDLQSFNGNTYETKGKKGKITARLEKIENIGADVCFQGIQSRQFYNNLKIIDGDLPEILAHCLYLRYLNRESSIEKLVDILEDSDPLNFYEGGRGQQKFYEYKIKKFLVESAMGMTSEAVWLGEYESFGGVIVAKKDGSVVCFHIYDFNLLRNYLLKRTKLEQAATGEDKNNPGHSDNDAKKKYFYGWLFKEDNDFFIKLNLQVRFK